MHDTGKHRGIFEQLINTEGDEVELQQTRDGWYVAEILISGVKTKLAVDTGSGVLWARKALAASGNDTVPAAEAPHGFVAQYGRGHVAGQVFEEIVRLHSEKPHKCAVGRAAEESKFWAHQNSIDGILGLGCSDGAAAGALSCIIPKATQKGSFHRTFCLQLRSGSGTLSIGFIPPQYQGNLVFMPPTQDCGHWEVPLHSLLVPKTLGEPQSNLLSDTSRAILDSGSTGIVGPTFAIIPIARLLGATPAQAGDGEGAEISFYQVPCAEIMSIPPVTFVLGTHYSAARVTLEGKDLVSVGDGSSKNCHLRLAGWETESWILGRVFLQKLQAVVFNLQNHQVALAVQPSDAASV